ncbi:hypothetical protein [Nonomuraea dietziae]
MENSELLNVVDVEATCWDGRPPPGSGQRDHRDRADRGRPPHA